MAVWRFSGSYLKECARNPEKAKELEESLAYFKEEYENGLKSAQANARDIGARIVNHTESWSIDSTGNITMMASAMVTSDSGVKGWKELAEEREEKLKEKKEQERTGEKRKEQKEEYISSLFSWLILQMRNSRLHIPNKPQRAGVSGVPAD